MCAKKLLREDNTDEDREILRPLTGAQGCDQRAQAACSSSIRLNDCSRLFPRSGLYNCLCSWVITGCCRRFIQECYVPFHSKITSLPKRLVPEEVTTLLPGSIVLL